MVRAYRGHPTPLMIVPSAYLLLDTAYACMYVHTDLVRPDLGAAATILISEKYVWRNWKAMA